MRLHEYQKLSMRTAPQGGLSLIETQAHLVHSMLGLAGEVAEILQDKSNRRNVIQEIGDCMWYIGVGCTGVGFDMEDFDLNNYDPDDYYEALSIETGIACDLVKRHIYYGVELNRDKLIKTYCKIVTCLVIIATEAGADLHECLILNVDKLRIRYPDKFDPSKAVNRNVKKENEIFES